jgi:hypothetical protein
MPLGDLGGGSHLAWALVLSPRDKPNHSPLKCGGSHVAGPMPKYISQRSRIGVPCLYVFHCKRLYVRLYWRCWLPKKTEMLTIKLTKQEHDDLREYARQENQTMSELVRDFVRSIQRKLKRRTPRHVAESTSRDV